MPTPISGYGAVPAAAPNANSMMSALSGMGGDDFLRLMVAQLQYQNPLEPQDPGQMMVQTAQLAQLESVQQLLTMQQLDLGLQQATAAAATLGGTVTAITSDGQTVTGTVEAVRYTERGPVLDVGGTEVLFGSVVEVRRPTD